MHVDYGFVLSPNQTPYRDMYFLEKLLGLGANDGVAVNTVFTRLCWLMGVWPAVYASLLLPSAKSGNKVQCTGQLTMQVLCQWMSWHHGMHSCLYSPRPGTFVLMNTSFAWSHISLASLLLVKHPKLLVNHQNCTDSKEMPSPTSLCASHPCNHVKHLL